MPPLRMSAFGFTASVAGVKTFSWSNRPRPRVSGEGGRGTSSAFSTIEIEAGPQKAGLIWFTKWLLSGKKSFRASAPRSSAWPSSLS